MTNSDLMSMRGPQHARLPLLPSDEQLAKWIDIPIGPPGWVIVNDDGAVRVGQLDSHGLLRALGAALGEFSQNRDPVAAFWQALSPEDVKELAEKAADFGKSASQREITGGTLDAQGLAHPSLPGITGHALSSCLVRTLHVHGASACAVVYANPPWKKGDAPPVTGVGGNLSWATKGGTTLKIEAAGGEGKSGRSLLVVTVGVKGTF